MYSSLLCSNKATTHLHPFCSECHSSIHSPTCSNSSCCNHRNSYFSAYLRHQYQSSSLLSSIMSTCFKAFSHYGIYPSCLSFESKLTATDHMYHFYSFLMEFLCPKGWVSCRGKDHRNSFLHNNLHRLSTIGIHDRHIYPKRFICMYFTLSDLST